MKVPANATPEASVIIVIVPEPLNAPDAPDAGAANITLTPAIGIPATSFTVTESGMANGVPIWAVCGEAAAGAVMLCCTCVTGIWTLVPVIDEVTVSVAVMV